uniref:CD209 antigen-like protein E n=1 Tax=Fundulus heteroclitus TaxID=8078 RepID=A0A3Q2QI44_FUNHE
MYFLCSVSRSSKKRIYLGVLICLGLLNVFLLTALISLGVRSHGYGCFTADFSDIKDNLTDRLQHSNDQLIFMTKQRDLLRSNLTEMSKELIRLQSLSKQKKTCPAGWSMSGSSCYLLSTNTGSWDEGREDCENRGGDLVVIDNSEEQRFISTFTDKEAWIGLNDKETEGSWKWVDGTSLTQA